MLNFMDMESEFSVLGKIEISFFEIMQWIFGRNPWIQKSIFYSFTNKKVCSVPIRAEQHKTMN
jgi:hypothetical protein